MKEHVEHTPTEVPAVADSVTEDIRTAWKKILPEAGRRAVWQTINFIRDRILAVRAYQEMGSNYESFHKFILQLESESIGGDICEIGTFNGKGAGKLLSMIRHMERDLVVIDPFEDEDVSDRAEFAENGYGEQKGLWARFPEQLFWANLKRQNPWFRKSSGRVNLLKEDSKAVEFPADQELAFSFIDGNHSPEYVRHDFEMIFEQTTVGGFIAMHDYEGILKHTTEAIDQIIQDYAGKIEIAEINEAYITIVFRKISK